MNKDSREIEIKIEKNKRRENVCGRVTSSLQAYQ